jgi:hypothetical protein
MSWSRYALLSRFYCDLSHEYSHLSITRLNGTCTLPGTIRWYDNVREPLRLLIAAVVSAEQVGCVIHLRW